MTVTGTEMTRNAPILAVTPQINIKVAIGIQTETEIKSTDRKTILTHETIAEATMMIMTVLDLTMTETADERTETIVLAKVLHVETTLRNE